MLIVLQNLVADGSAMWDIFIGDAGVGCGDHISEGF
jgi:hypothetical protein